MINTILNKLYPQSLFSWKKPLGFGVFIMFFLFVFQPFGLQMLSIERSTGIVIGYGLLTFSTMIFNQFVVPLLFPTIFKETNWTVLKQILWVFWNVLIIAILNFYYSIYVLELPNNLHYLLLFLLYTSVTAILPISIITMVSQKNKLQANLHSAQQINQQLKRQMDVQKSDGHLTLLAANRKDSVTTNSSHLLYMESVGNYATIRWVENGQVLEKKLRNTLKDLEKQVNDTSSVIKTHKAFIVNLQQVHLVDGNAQGYTLTLKTEGIKVPVSRTYIKLFNAAMASI